MTANAPPPPQASDPVDAEAHVQLLSQEMDWLQRFIGWRFHQYFGTEGEADAEPPPAPEVSVRGSPYAALLRRHSATDTERLALALALAPHLRPQLLDVFFTRNKTFDKPFAEFGGHTDAQGSHFSPSGETLAFLVAGAALAPRLALAALFEPGHWLVQHDLLRLVPAEPAQPGAMATGLLPDGASLPPLRRLVQLSPDAAARLVNGRPRPPELGHAFPARPVTTALGWDDLVLHPGTLAQLGELRMWLRHGHTLLHTWGMANRLRPGLRALFHGPPGTGKTLTAALLGQAAGRAVWQVDLSLVVSKYIGETEKNLARVFDMAQQQGWLLFFDEADALFGKRSDTRDAHDRYANQEVAWLLQRIETFDGIAILASNQRDNIDPAFARRFEAVIHFPLPRADERARLWRQSLPAAVSLAPDVDLAQIAARHELAGGEIINVVRHACLQALDEGHAQLTDAMLQRAIRRELAKDGRQG